MRKRNLAMLLALLGLAVGLIGWGVSASYSDSATAAQNVNVGTFGISISSTTAGAVVVNSGSTHTVTFDAGTLQSSAAGTAPLAFRVTGTGTIPAWIHVTQTTPAAPFVSLLAAPGDVRLGNGQFQDYAAGLSWPMLVNADLGKNTTIVYTIGASENPAVTLSSIVVTPAAPSMDTGAPDMQFTATGHYSDSTTANLTSSVVWASSTPAKATITAGGLAHAVTFGTSTISATVGAVSSSTVLTINPGIPTFTRSAGTMTIRVHLVDGTPILPGDTLSTYNMAVVSGTQGWNNNLATADAAGVIYYTGNGIGTCVPIPAGPPLYMASPCTGVAPTGQAQITIKRGGSIMKTFAARL
jgi:Big-like domain-containing protein